MSNLDGMSTSRYTIWYILTAFVLTLRCSSVGHGSWVIMLETLFVCGFQSPFELQGIWPFQIS